MRDLERDTPIDRVNLIGADAACAREILAASDPRDGEIRRTQKDLFLRTASHDAAGGKHEQIRAQPVDFLQIMADEKRGAGEMRELRAEFAFDFSAQVRIERGERFIQQKRGGIGGERASEGDALLLSAGELVRIAFLEAGQMEALDFGPREASRASFEPAGWARRGMPKATLSRTVR